MGVHDRGHRWQRRVQNDLSKGTLVGTVTLTYSAGTATVTFQMLEGKDYNLGETHLYVGSTPLYDNVTAPGQFPAQHSGLKGALSDTYTVTGLSGEIYVAAHAVVRSKDFKTKSESDSE